MLKIGDYLITLAVVLVTVIVVVSPLRGDPVATTPQFALVLTVAAIPVAMPTVLPVTMAVGARLRAVPGTQAIATLIAVYGLFMTPRAGAGRDSCGPTLSSGLCSATASSFSLTGFSIRAQARPR